MAPFISQTDIQRLAATDSGQTLLAEFKVIAEQIQKQKASRAHRRGDAEAFTEMETLTKTREVQVERIQAFLDPEQMVISTLYSIPSGPPSPQISNRSNTQKLVR